MNSAQRYQEAMELFHQVCDLSMEQRSAFLADACGNDAELRRAVERLVEHDSEACEAVEAGEQGEGIRAISAITVVANDAVPKSIGQYNIVRKIGQGGMGIVYEAQQDHPRRTVAVKVLHSAVGTSGLLKRFQREANLLGRLQHPGIAQVFDAGVGDVETESGIRGRQPFFAMELIDGQSLDQYARSHHLDDRARLELLASVCHGVQHAHERGVIHRDLKPSNILVTPTGQPKILDFGVSRATDADVHTITLQTDAGQLVGTIPYMSPEQVMGDPTAIDEQTDVYSLGVVLYELLTGDLPHDLRNRPIPESVRTIREDEPTRLGSVDRRFRGDIETIVAKALGKEKTRRYGSAAELAADIRRYLDDEPIVARPASAMYNLRKFARRNKGLVGGLVATFVVLLLGVAGTAIGLVSALLANEKLELTNEKLADTNRELEQSNSNLQKVSEFQSAQITGIDVPLMGLRLRDDLLEAVPEDRQSTLETQLGGINFIDVARSSLEQNFFGRAIDMVDSQFADQPLLHAGLLQDLATTMRQLGILSAATDPQERALQIRRRELGDDHADTLLSINESAILTQNLGDYPAAETLFREVLEANRRLVGMKDEGTLTTRGSLCDNLRHQARYEEAETCARETLETIQELAGPEDPETASAMAILAAVLKGTGNYEEAEQWNRQALDIRRRVFGDEHPDTLNAIGNLGNILEDGGKYDESVGLAQEAYETRSRVLGNDHPDTIDSMTEYASRLARQGKYDQAEPLLIEALAKRRSLLGDDHPQTINSMDALASMLVDQARFEESEALFRESLERRRRVLGDDHQATLRAIGNVGYVLSQQGKSEETEPFYRETLAGFRRHYGDDHPHTLTAIGNLAVLLSGMGKDEEAEPLYFESLEGRRKLLGEDHPSTLNAIYSMGDMLRRQGKLDQAEPYCRQSLEGYQRVGGDDHIGTLYSLNQMGRLMMDRKQPADAETYFLEVVERRRRINGDDHPQTLEGVSGLADALDAQELWSDAEPWRRFVQQSLSRAEPVNSMGLADALHALGRNLLRQQRPSEAEAPLAECLTLYKGSEFPNDWPRWNAQSLLGQAIAADQDRYDEAEALLLEAAEHAVNLPDVNNDTEAHVAKLRQRLVSFYENCGKLDEAMKWR
jgi:serine/threonine protein kinase